MKTELKTVEEVPSVIVRSSEEVSERIQQLEALMEQNDIWGHFGGKGKTRSPEYGPIFTKYEAKRDELKWLLGEDVEIG